MGISVPDVGGLDPGRSYLYRFSAGRTVSRAGRTKKAPAPAARPSLQTARRAHPWILTIDDHDVRNTAAYCPAQLHPSRTITGDEQEQRLLKGLGSSTTDWSVLANHLCNIPPGIDDCIADPVATEHMVTPISSVGDRANYREEYGPDPVRPVARVISEA